LLFLSNSNHLCFSGILWDKLDRAENKNGELTLLMHGYSTRFKSSEHC
jgi:hypothetical protein